MKIKYLVSLVVLIFLSIFIYYLLNVQKESRYDYNDTSTQNIDNNVKLNIKKTTTQKNKIKPKEEKTELKDDDIPHYKDIFKEESLVEEQLKLTQMERELKKIDEEAQSLIIKADRFIEKNNLILPKQQLTQDEQEKIEQYNEKIESLQQQLQEFENE